MIGNWLSVRSFVANKYTVKIDEVAGQVTCSDDKFLLLLLLLYSIPRPSFPFIESINDCRVAIVLIIRT